MNEKEIKAEIRRLRKIKLACRPGTPERLDLEHKIKDLKKQKADINIIDPGKEKLIADILAVDVLLGKLDINLNKFSVAELQKHLDILRKGIK